MKYDFNGKILNIPDKDLEVLEKNLDISFNESILGYPLPDSHFETAVLET